MGADRPATDDLAFAWSVIGEARWAGADHAQVLTSVSDKTEVVCGALQSASMREISSRNTSLLVVCGGRLGSASFSDSTGHSVGDAVAEALRKAAIATPNRSFALAEGGVTAPTEYGDERPDSRQLVELAVDYTAAMRRDYPSIITREANCHHNLVRTTFCNSNGVVQQETRGVYGFSTLFAARAGGRTTAFASYGVNALAPFDKVIDQGDQRRRYEATIRGLYTRSLDAQFVGTIIVAPEAMGFIVAPLLRAITITAQGDPAANRVPEEIASPVFSLSNRPYGPSLAMGRDFDGYGRCTENIDVIVEGRLKAPLVDFVAASRHGLQQNFGWTAIVVRGGSKRLADLIASTERGIIFSNFSGSTDRDMEFSGAARNSFYIEEGRIVCALDNVMISGNIRQVLRSVSDVSSEIVDSGTAIFPYLSAQGVFIQSASGDAISPT